MRVAILQARMTSSRLPGKTMAEINGKPMLWHVIQRLKKCKMIDKIIIATTTNSTDTPIEKLSHDLGLDCFRGSEDDVLGRYAGAVEKFGGDVIVRVTADCPFLDPWIVDKVIAEYEKYSCEFAANVYPPTYPDGLDVEVFSRELLMIANREAKLESQREHVTPFMWGNKDRFKQCNVTNSQDLSSLRWTVDEPQDLEFARQVYILLGEKGKSHTFTMADVLEVLEINPEVARINSQFMRNERSFESLRKDGLVGSGQVLWKRAKKIIPGGSQLLSKRSEMFLPDQWPSYYSKAKGIEIWDLDGKKYTDMCIMGIGSCILGYADDDVDSAVKKRIDNANMATLNCPEEVELAEMLISLNPWAGGVRYARTGGESMAMAVRIARAHAKKDKVAFCGYHGWQDWYLATNLKDPTGLNDHLLKGLEPVGVPASLSGTAIPFHYNKIEELESLVEKNKDVGVIVVETIRNKKPENDFLKKIRKIADEVNAVLVLDEITSAWRLNVGGAYRLFGIEPDMVVFGKAMSNGFPMGAVVGRSEVMDNSQQSFISSTYWTEGIGPTAALATIKKLEEKNVPKHIVNIGEKTGRIWEGLAKEHELKLHVDYDFPPIMHFDFDYGNSQEIATLFTQEMLQRGYLASRGFYVSYAHTEEDILNYREIAGDVFKLLKNAIETKTIGKMLKGPVAHTGFQRLT